MFILFNPNPNPNPNPRNLKKENLDLNPRNPKNEIQSFLETNQL